MPPATATKRHAANINAGLVTSTLFTLLVLPAVYLVAEQAKRKVLARLLRRGQLAAVLTDAEVACHDESGAGGGQ